MTRRDASTKRAGAPLDPATRAGRGFFHAMSASSVGLEFGVAVALALGLGIYLDRKLGTQPWLMLVCLAFGFAAGFRGVLRAVDRSDRAAAREDHG
ncbi:MAG: AtpZ/AtpI family protein [Kofleriaceae bacterium]